MSSKIERAIQALRYRASKIVVPDGQVRIVQTRTQGFDLLVRANEDVGRWIHFGRAFEVAETVFLRRIVGPEAVCIDVGANVGYFTLLMANAAPRGMVHAFEPLPLNAALVAASAALNKCRNIRVNAAAVGETPGEIEFVEAVDSAYSSIFDTGRKAVGSRFKVPVVTLDTYLTEHGVGPVDIMKVDVEGAEAMVLGGAARLFGDRARRPTTLMIELCQENLTPFGATVAGIAETLTGYGYSASVLDREGGLIPYAPASQHQYNIVFTATRD